MADIDIDPFEGHEWRPEEPTDENIPLIPGRGGVQTWDPRPGQSTEHEQETSFTDNERKEELVRTLQLDIFRGSKNFPDDFHFVKVELRNDQLYYKENDGKPLTTKKGGLRTVKESVKILGIKGLRDLGYNVPEGQSARDFIKMKRAKEKLPSALDITKAEDIELIELSRESSRISEDLIMDIIDTQTQTDDSLLMQELLGLDTQLRSIRGSLKVEVAKKVQLKEHTKKEQRKLERIREYPVEYDDGIREDITK